MVARLISYFGACSVWYIVYRFLVKRSFFFSPATGSNVVNLGAFTQMMDLTQKQLSQKVDESFTVLEKLLKCQTASMPSVDAFVPPDPSGRDFIFYFDKSEMIHLAEYRIQVSVASS